MTATLRVLVVDEDRDVRDLTRTFLEREDDRFTVVTAESAPDALDRVEDEHVDAVVSDYRMPGTDGTELAAQLAAREEDLPFVLFSAAEDAAIEAAAQATGVDRVVGKRTGTAHYAEIATAIRELVDS